MPLSPGQILHNRYRIVKLLGQGGFGAVYRAWDINLDRPCAVKENLDASPQAQAQFGREARILANLIHPNLARVIDYFFIPGQGQYFVMDFVEGEDLQQMLVRTGGPLPEAQVLEWLRQVCDALSYLHSQNPPIIHRDVKPANIKITPQGKAVVVDFGIAKLYDPHLKTTVGARAVTPGYSPFEQYGNAPTDARTDVYALGATAYNLLTGQMPTESIARIAGMPMPALRAFNSQINPAAEKAILRALDIMPMQRYQSAADFKSDLANLAPPDQTILNIGSTQKILNPVFQPTMVQTNDITLIHSLKGHSGAVNSIAWKTNRFLASGGDDKLVLIWDITGGTISHKLTGHKKLVWSVAWSPDGQRLASASEEPTILLWDTKKWGDYSILDGHMDSVNNLAWSPDGKRLASASSDTTVLLWDLNRGTILKSLRHSDAVNSVTWSPDGQRLATANENQTILIWDATKGIILRTLKLNKWIGSVVWSPNGAWLACGSDEGTIAILEATSANVINEFDGHANNVYCVAWSLDGRFLASCGDDRQVVVLDAFNGAMIAMLDDHKDKVEVVAWSPDGRFLASGSWDKTIKIWEINL